MSMPTLCNVQFIQRCNISMKSLKFKYKHQMLFKLLQNKQIPGVNINYQRHILFISAFL